MEQGNRKKGYVRPAAEVCVLDSEYLLDLISFSQGQDLTDPSQGEAKRSRLWTAEEYLDEYDLSDSPDGRDAAWRRASQWSLWEE